MQDFDATLYATMRPARGGKSLVTLSTYQERQEALNRTSIMEDDSSHRTSRHFPNEKSSINETAESQQQQQQQQQQQSNQQNIPPPPPQFANSPPKNQGNNNYSTYYQTIKRVNGTISSTSTIKQQSSTNAPKPPNSPVPDYDNVDFRKGKQVQTNVANGNRNKTTSSTASTGNTNANRHTMRLGAVTIGEYEQQRKEPGKFEFVGNKTRDTSNGYNNSRNIDNLHSELHDTLSRSKLKNGTQTEHQRDCPLRNGYANGNGVDQLTRKIQGANLNQKQAHNGEGTATIKRQSSGTTNGTGTGILKNGNSRNNNSSNNSGINGHAAKIIEKTITFGN